MPPPSTPAPRRFLPAQPRPLRTPSHDAGDDNRPAQGVDDLLLRGDAHSQFAVTPRFSTSRSRPQQRRPDPAASVPVVPFAHHTTTQPDVMLDGSQSDPGEEDVMLLDRVAANESWSDDLTLSPKRRRLSDTVHPSRVKAATGGFARPLQPASSYASREVSTKQRFVSSSARSAVSAPARTKVPSFASLLQGPHDDGPEQPLPDAFSPHRQGDRYVAGGMARTLQQWVLEAGQTALHARRADQAYVMKVSIKSIELESEAITLLEGSIEYERGVNIVLINDSIRRRRSQQMRFAPDMTLGLKEPCWPATLVARHWVVCVDWKVLE